MPELFNFENAMPGMIGFSHVQGTRIPVFDLHPRLEPGKGRLLKFTSQTRLLIAEVHGVKTGFLADRLTDMIQARAHEMKKETIYGHGRPKLIVVLEELWPSTELAELAA